MKKKTLNIRSDVFTLAEKMDETKNEMVPTKIVKIIRCSDGNNTIILSNTDLTFEEGEKLSDLLAIELTKTYELSNE